MKVLRADILGYCMGVRRAVEMACGALSEYSDFDFTDKLKGSDNIDSCYLKNNNALPPDPQKKRTVYTFGPLIHNKIALESLARRGLQVLDESGIDALDSGNPPVVIIRAHGVPPEIREKLLRKKCLIIDATCPRVLASQRMAENCALKGCAVIIAGDKMHGEVAGIAGCVRHAGQECIVLENRIDAERLFPYPQKAVLISQTTISRSEYDAITDVLNSRIPDLHVFNSICPATLERQNALDKLCKQVDGVLVVGGRNSANTQRLFTIASEKCKKVAFIETSSEIPPEFFNLQKVGLTAGASTPDEVIDGVEQALTGVL